MKKQLLCVSWTALLQQVRGGSIKPEQLGNALFYFGCKLEHLEQPWADDESYRNAAPDDKLTWFASNELTWLNGITRYEADELHATVHAAVKKALEEGRAAFREDEPISYATLNEVLESCGFDQLDTGAVDSDGGSYSYPGVQTRVEKAGLALEVVH